MAQSIKTLKIKRNVGTYASLTALTTAVKDSNFIKKPEIASMSDGELIMFRYLDENGNTATLMGTIYNPNDTTKEIHLEMSTAEVKKLIQQGIDAGVNNAIENAKVKVPTSDNVLAIDSKQNLTSTINIVKQGNNIQLVGKNSKVINSVDLSTIQTKTSVSFKWIPNEAKLQLIGESNNVLSEVDFPFETMVTDSELTADNNLKLTFNTTKGQQDVIVNLDKLKDIYTAGDSTILVSSNKISTKISSVASKLPLVKKSDGLWVDDSDYLTTKNGLSGVTNRVSSLETKVNNFKLPDVIDLGIF